MSQTYSAYRRKGPVIVEVRSPALPDRLLHTIALLGLGLLIGFDVLAFGGVEEWSILVLQCAATLLFLVALVGRMLGEQHRAEVPLVLAPLALFGVLITAQVALNRSAYRYLSYSELLLYAAYGMLFVVAIIAVRHQRDYKRIATAASFFGSAVALFASLQELTSDGKMYWHFEMPRSAVMFGSYVNHNHYAGMMELLIPIPLVLGVTGMYSGGKRTLLIFAAVLMSGSVVLSLSRGGLIAVIAEFAFLLVFCMRSKYRHTSTGLVVGAILLVLLFLSLFDTSVIFERVATLGHVADEGVAGDRLMIARDGLKMFALHPVTGWGLGAFPAIYPHFRSFYTNLFVNQAHNDWLQLLVETGIVGMLLTIWFLFLVYRRGFKNARRWYREPRAALNLAALAAITGLLVHSFSDFNLHIPANAALFFVMCGLVFSGPDDQEE